MTIKTYALEEGKYKIYDEDLGLDIDEEFIYGTLPTDIAFCVLGLHIEYDTEGNMTKAYTLKENLRHGQARHYHRDGSIYWEGFYKEGLLHGPSRYFSENGAVLSHTWFYQGKEIGPSYQYTLSGTLCSRLSYLRGSFHGVQEYYYDDGTLKTLMHYILGALHGSVELFYEDGSLKRSCYFIAGKKQGLDRIMSRQGIVLDEGHYDLGMPCGIHIRRYPSGSLREEITYTKEGNVNKRRWDEEGVLLEGVKLEPLL